MDGMGMNIYIYISNPFTSHLHPTPQPPTPNTHPPHPKAATEAPPPRRSPPRGAPRRRRSVPSGISARHLSWGGQNSDAHGKNGRLHLHEWWIFHGKFVGPGKVYHMYIYIYMYIHDCDMDAMDRKFGVFFSETLRQKCRLICQSMDILGAFTMMNICIQYRYRDIKWQKLTVPWKRIFYVNFIFPTNLPKFKGSPLAKWKYEHFLGDPATVSFCWSVASRWGPGSLP